MGNFKVKLFFCAIIVVILSSCNKNKTELVKSKQEFNLSRKPINKEESLYLIEKSEEFELKHNELFQEELQIKSKQYYENTIEKFIENETSFLRLFGELWDIPFKSENTRKVIWKLKIDRHFRSTSYLTYIRNEVEIYTDGVNNQRNNGISKILGVRNPSFLRLPIASIDSFHSKDKTVKEIINKINTEIIDQLSDAVLGFTPEIIIVLLGLIGVIGAKLPWPISTVVFIIIAGIFFWRSHIRQNEIREILKLECNKVISSTRIDYLDHLNKNTFDYYSQLKK
ncbi:hypothetical protein [Flavobacterium anhuiense]|uniref:hypothetical protein n=1 Tax=Flavobacterium anhuiense TaxID=459526 RepID=UPI003D99FE42